MLKSKYLVNLLLVLSFFTFTACKVNSNANAVNSQDSESGFIASGDCDVVFDPETNQIELVSDLTVGPESRARCTIRVQSPSSSQQVRLVPIAVKGSVTKAPATVSISSTLIGDDQPTSVSQEYTTPTSFDLTDRIPRTNYTRDGKSVFGINLIVSTDEGSLELTDLRFSLQQ